MDIAEHWHGYTWVGHELPADRVRRDPENPTPPLEIAQWLEKPRKHLAETFDNPAGIASASAWMRACGEEHPQLGSEWFPLDERIACVDESLHRGADVIWGYYSKQSRYISRALVACPRPGIECPLQRPDRRTVKAA